MNTSPEENIVLVDEFCKNFFNSKRQSSNVITSDKNFFKKHLYLFLKGHPSQNVYKLYNIIKGHCLDYCQEVITKGNHPFDFMESDFKSLYIENVLRIAKNELFHSYCSDNGIIDTDEELKKYDFNSMPKIIDNCLECICAYAQEFDIISIYVHQFSSSKEEIENAKNELSNAQIDIDKAKSEIEELKKDIRQANTDITVSVTKAKADFQVGIAQQEKKSTQGSITTLGVFVAIVSVLFGGISFINSGLTALKDVYSIKLFMLIAIIAIVMFDSILSLFYFISKATDKPIVAKNKCWLDCPKRIKCKECQNNSNCKKGWFRRIRNWCFRNIKKPICSTAQKSKFAFWINVVLANVILYLYTLYLFTHNQIFGDENISLLNASVSLILPAIIIITIFLIVKPCNNNDCYRKK